MGKTNDWQPRQWANSTIADQEHHVTIYKDVDPPAALLAQRGWVELPNCKGAAGEVKLADDLDNATWATCKPSALVQRGWVELPNCKSPLPAGEVKLADDLDNATWATCKSATPSA